MNPKDFEKILADFSNEPQRVQAFQIPMENNRQSLPLPQQNIYEQEMMPSHLDDRRANFEQLMGQLGELRGKSALDKIQVSQANPEAALGKMGNIDEAISLRNEQQRKAQLLRAFNKMMQGGARFAGAEISDASEMFDALERQSDQPVKDLQMKDTMRRQREQDSMGKEKHEVIMDDLRQKLEQSQLDFQNKQEVQDPTSQQSQFVQDFYMDMQRTMGKPVNEEQVRNASAEMLYKVSPWMQKIYSDQLMAKARTNTADRQERSLALRERELDEYKLGKESRLKDQFQQTMGEKQEEQSAKIVDKFESDKVVEKANQSLSQADNVIQLVQSDNPVGHAAIPTFMARASGEVGNLSEADKAPFGGSQSLSSRIRQVTEQYQNGMLTPENQAFVVDLAQTMKKSAIRNKASRALDLRDKYSKSYNMDMKDVNNLMMPELNNLDPEDQQAVEWALKNPTKPQADKILKLHGM